MTAALQLQQLYQSGRQNDIENALALRQFNESTLPLSQAQIANYNKPAETERYKTVSGGQTIYDLVNRGIVYQNPYKPTGSGDSTIDFQALLDAYNKQ